MHSDSDIEIDFEPKGKNGSGYLTASQDGEPIEFRTVNLANEKARADFAARVVKKCPTQDADDIEAKLMRLGAQLVAKSEPPPDEPPADDPGVLLSAMPDAVKAQARAMLSDTALAKLIADDIAALGVAGEANLALTVYLIGTSRLLTKPLAGIVQGPSSSGKSYVIEQVAQMMPPEGTVQATQMTPQALFHMKPGALKNRFVVAGERSRNENDERAEATRALREMLSAGRLTKLMPVKIAGEIQTKQLIQEGPIAFIESTTLTKIFDEDANRCILLTTDERRQQTERIVGKLAASYAGTAAPGLAADILDRHHALQRTLKPHSVVVPFAEQIGQLVNTDRVEVRRAFPMLMSMIQASALLHQYQRQIDEHGRLIAELADYVLAHLLLSGPLGRSLGGRLSDAAIRFHERLTGYVKGTFTSREIVAHERGTASPRAVYGWLSELNDSGLIDLIEAGRGPKPHTWRLTGLDPHEATGAALPTPKELGAAI